MKRRRKHTVVITVIDDDDSKIIERTTEILRSMDRSFRRYGGDHDLIETEPGDRRTAEPIHVDISRWTPQTDQWCEDNT